MRLQDRVTIVTGGGSGIGRAISLLFAAEGAKIVVADLVPERTTETAELIAATGGSAIGVPVDVSKAETVATMAEAAVTEYGRIDILVNNAGLSVGDTILDFDEAAWDLNLNVVLKGVYLCSRAIVPGMIDRGHGVILNISSVNGMMAVGEAAYSAAKAGMINLTANMAIHHGDQGIRVNCIAPGTIRTPIWDPRVARDPQVFDKISRWYPLGRVGEPEDVAKAALFLCSDDADWITGITLPVDGGLTAGSYGINRDLQNLHEAAGS
jgi:meso-butanediol dehydrogenase/(S,S)-butanediol dehydrogenase/diacetyl reductase